MVWAPHTAQDIGKFKEELLDLYMTSTIILLE